MEKRKNTKEAILAAAEYEFVTKSYESARTVSIAERAGVTHAMLHYYYRTKELLFETVFESKVSQMKDTLFIVLENTDEPFMDRLMKTVSVHFDFMAKNPSLPQFIMNIIDKESPYSKIAGKLVSKHKEELVRMLNIEIDKAVEKREIKHINAEALLLDIITFNVFTVYLYKKMEVLGVSFYSDYEEYCAKRKQEILELISGRLKN